MIGDCRSAALVSDSGSVDWLCWPRFDSDPVFGRLLHAREGGSFTIRPAIGYRVSRAYRHESNVLETTFETADGSLRLTDLFAAVPLAARRRMLLPESLIVRRVECIGGAVPVSVQFEPRLDFGRRPVPVMRRDEGSVVCEMGGRRLLQMASDAHFVVEGERVRADLRLDAGETAAFALSMTNDEPAVYPPLESVDEIIRLTDEYWRGWSSRCRQDVPYREAVVRSALTLKLLSFSPSGAVVASPTTSLPEVPGGDKNWDYRYCWLRDASLTVRAFRDLGYEEEASAFAQWILHATRLTRPKLQVLYDVYGRTPGAEKEIEGVSGYRGALPVRAGNLAMDQVQLDVYGEVLEAVAVTAASDRRLSRDERLFLEEIIRYAVDHWREPDSGIWEMRGEPRQFVESKVMCWLAATRGAELADRGVVHMDAGKLRRAAHEIRAAVVGEGFDSRRKSFRDALGKGGLDAALLRLTLVGFCGPGDEWMKGTIEAIRERLYREGLVYRREDEMRSGEGAFVICSFWLADCLARTGVLGEAREMFERLLSRANDVGLYAEEIDVESGAFRGNFPLAFSHVGLINAAVSIGRGGGGG